MRRLAGQAARHLWIVTHRLCAIMLALLVVIVAASAVLAWRLSEGPIEIPWIGARIAAAVNQQAEHVRLEIGSSALAWEGFHRGQGSPVDIRLDRISLVDASRVAQVAIPRAEITLSLLGLLAGRIEPEEITIDQPTTIAERSSDGRISLIPASGASAPTAGPDVDPVAILAELARPPATDTSRGPAGDLSRLRRLRIDGATLRLIDRRLGVTWQVPQAGLDLMRAKQGGLQGQMALVLALGDQRAQLKGSISLPPGGTETSLQLQLSPVLPAAWANAISILPPLAALDMPVGGEVEVTLGPHLAVRQMRLAMQAGAGTVHIDGGTVPIEQATLVASGTPERMVLETARVVLPVFPATSSTTIEMNGQLQRHGGQMEASLALHLDHVPFAALPQLWPTGIARDARHWMVQNVTAGTAHDGHFEVTLTAKGDLTGLALTHASGSLQGDGLTVYWLRPVPPVVQGQAVLHLIDPDTIEIIMPSGQSAPETPGVDSLAVRGLQMRVAGLTRKQQTAAIKAEVSGSLPAAIALLRDPRLSLLSRHPLPLNDPAGQVDAHLTVSLPLDARVTMDQIAIGAQAHLTGVHLGHIVASNNLDQGTLDLTAGNNGLSLNGTALIAGTAAQLQASMNFRSGPPDQVVQKIGVTGRPDTHALAAAGLDSGGFLVGSVPLSVELSERRNGTGTVDVTADLTPATLAVDALGWRKANGRPATATAVLMLDHDRLTGIDPIAIKGDGVDLQGDAAFAQGHLATLRASRLRLDRTTAQAVVHFPPGAGPISASLSGAVLDLSGRFAPRTGLPTARKPPAASPPGPPWTADARFEQVLLANQQALTDVTAHAVDDGQVVRDLRLNGFTGKQAPVAVAIRSDGQRRALTASAADAGVLLRGLDATNSMEGGRLSISATYEDVAAGHPLAGSAEIDDFSLRNAPAVGKLLQAVTLYGLVEALRGPGLGFSKLIAPFRWRDGVLSLDDARAFSSSLGLTAKGWLDLDAQRLDLQGTIVPAYVFNSLLGKVPVLGRLFSPERGGGVIAGSYSLQGSLDNPNVAVNPLTALTPGFLRGLFKIF